MIAKVAIIAVLACFAVADRNPYRPPQPSYRPPQPSYRPPQPAPSRYRSDESFEVPNYNFDWEVNEAYNSFNQQESRDDDNTKGQYVVDLPDGRRQTVTYYVDGDSGFVAEVSYSGEARHPDSNEYRAPARPTYQAPTTRRPSYTTPRPSYQPPTTRRPSYTTPRPSYQPPRPSYRPPRPSYRAPNSLLSAFGVN